MGEVYRVRQDASQIATSKGCRSARSAAFVIERNAAARRRVRVPGQAVPHQPRARCAGSSIRTSSRSPSTAQRVHLASFGGDERRHRRRARTRRRRATRSTSGSRCACRSRPARARSRVAFLEKTHGNNTRRLQSYIRSSADTIDFSGYPHIDQFIITGPFKPTGVGDTPSRRGASSCCRPRELARRGSARARGRILSTAGAARVPRRPERRRPRRSCSTSIERGRDRAGTFDGGIDLALRRILASPKFVFRVERDPAGVAAGSVYRLSDLELASRLSFFLWSSIPDDELLQVAAKGELKNAGGARAAGAPDAGRSEGARARRRTSPASGCTCAT